MDGLYPTSYCNKQPVKCADGKCVNTGGGVWVSNAFIRNRGQTSFPTMSYDEGWPDYLTNNPPPTPLYVRVAPSQFNPNKQVFWINGWQQPRLILTKGKKYQFNVSTCGHPFYLTSDPEGGQGSKGDIGPGVPSDFYVSTYTMNPGTPNKFYYQCSLHPGMGGEVVIKEN